MDLRKIVLQKDIHYFKYREFSGIFTINDHISDNSVQINIKFTFTVYEYILLSNLIYIYIYTYYHIIYIYIYAYMYNIFTYIYIYIYELYVFYLLQHCRKSYTQSFPAGFTSRNGRSTQL